jgi:hypothetical protein
VGGFPQHPGKVLWEWAGLPCGTCDTCQSLIGRRRIQAYVAYHVAKIDMCHHLIGPCGTHCHVSMADWSTSKMCRNFPKHPGNFPKTPGTFQKHPELPKNTRNFPRRPGNFPKHPWNFRTPRKLPKNTRVGGGWWVGGWVPTTPEEGPTGVGRTATWHM